MIDSAQPRRGFPRLLGSTSGEAAGMGPSAARLSHSLTRADGNDAARIREARSIADAGQPSSPASVDTAKLAERYRRAAERMARETSDEPSGPAVGRLKRDNASRVARARAAHELAAPINSPTTNAGDLPARIANARANAAGTAAGALSSERPTSLRERAFANPKRTRNAIRNSSAGAAASGTAIDMGLNFGLGWPANAGGGINFGDWDDGWSFWFDWCHHGWNFPGSHWCSSSWWHSNCGWGWPYGFSFWWWGSYWYPYLWYGSYSPSTVVIYRDATPTTTYGGEAPPSYAPESAPSSVGEGLIDDSRDPGNRVVDESMAKLVSPAAISASRAATQNLTQGDGAFREGRYGDAVHFYAKAIEFQPDEGVLYLVLSDALFATGDYHYGAYALRKALELDPTLVENPVDKHSFYPDAKEFDRQLAVLEIYLKDRPTDQDARLLLAANYLFGGRPAAAVDLLDAAASELLRKTPIGTLLLESARKQQYDAAKESVAK